MMYRVYVGDQLHCINSDRKLSGVELANHINKNNDIIGLYINDTTVDCRDIINDNDDIYCITKADNKANDIMRHSCAHLLAHALSRLFNNVKFGIGPVIENGFFYDFTSDETIKESDLTQIEQMMIQIIDENHDIIRSTVSQKIATKTFADDPFKQELIKDIGEVANITIYNQGEFSDLCRGPHVASTGGIPKSFKLTKVSGSYWRGDSKNLSMQRIYGVLFNNHKELEEYLVRLEEADKRDHRKLGQKMMLYHFQDIARGIPFWHHRGYVLYRTIETYIRNKLEKHEYIEVKTPILLDQQLWHKSGHWDKFKDNMFCAYAATEKDIKDIKNFSCLKPMNCPAHIQIFNQGNRSYRDLPLRMAEFGICHRNEASGAMHGLTRTVAFVQDDAHIFCTIDQIETEIVQLCQLIKEVYADFGMASGMKVKFSDRPSVRAGSDEVWDAAETALSKAATSTGCDLIYNKGEGAFYGPKLEFVLTDAIGRDWQCGTVQLDFVLPERLDALYIDQNGNKKHAVMIHRAILGSIERFIGVLLEHYNGYLPFWLSPVQIVVATITDEVADYGNTIYKQLCTSKLRTIKDFRSDKISYKIREHSIARIPLMMIVGIKEKESAQIVIRNLQDNTQIIIEQSQCVDYISNLYSKI